jgi:hypothetical protein
MLPFLIGFVVLAVGAASALYTTKTAPVAAPTAPPAPVAEPNAILARLIKAGAKPSWGLVVPEKWAVKV